MIKGMLLHNQYCILVKSSMVNISNGNYRYHSEQWLLYDKNKNNIGLVLIIEKFPLVTRTCETYELQCYTIPENDKYTQGYERYNVQQTRVDLLRNAIQFIKNN